MSTSNRNSGNNSANHKYSSVRSGEYDDQEHGGGSHLLSSTDKKLRNQNRSLDLLGNSVAKLGELSLTISKEINTQNKMLDSLETDIESASERSNNLLQKTRELVKKTGGTRNVCIILVLVVVLLLLVMLVIYT